MLLVLLGLLEGRLLWLGLRRDLLNLLLRKSSGNVLYLLLWDLLRDLLLLLGYLLLDRLLNLMSRYILLY